MAHSSNRPIALIAVTLAGMAMAGCACPWRSNDKPPRSKDEPPGFFQSLVTPEPPAPPKTIKEWMSLQQIHP
jgi:hypothetical protein